MTQVLADPVKDDRRQLNLTDERVAAPTEEPAHTTSVVTVVHHEIAARGIAEQASTSLRLRHRLNLLGREVVLPHQAGQPCHADVLLEIANKEPSDVH